MMLRSTTTNGAGTLGIGINLSQVRHKRVVAYARFPIKQNFNSKPKFKTTNLKKSMDLFLGPKNFKGEYHFNKYYYSSTNHVPKYVNPEFDQGNSLIDNHLIVTKPRNVRAPMGKRLFQPFPENDQFLTNFQISYKLKKDIINDILVKKISTQEAAVKYGLKIPRLEALIRLNAIEKKWKEDNLITPELTKMAHAVYKMLPIKEVRQEHAENLTEIPIPPETQRSRFLTIAESEPFGPIDAAKVFNLEPAQVTLEKLSDLGEHSDHHTSSERKSKQSSNSTKSFLAEKKIHERFYFKFTDVKSGNVGYRYGTTNRDTKKDRKIGYDKSGKMIYLVQ